MTTYHSGTSFPITIHQDRNETQNAPLHFITSLRHMIIQATVRDNIDWRIQLNSWHESDMYYGFIGIFIQ